MWELSLAGSSLELRAAGRWLCTMVSRDDWPTAAALPPPSTKRAAAAAGGALKPGAGSGSGGDGVLGDGGRIGSPSPSSSDGGAGSADGPVCSGSEAGRQWHAAWGDRHNALVFIGVGLRSAAARDALARALHGCLLSSDEEAAGEAAWDEYDDASWLLLLEQY